MPQRRTALLIRLSAQEAARVRKVAQAEHRSVSGYLLHTLERSIWIEEKFAKGFAGVRDPGEFARLSRVKGGRTGILLRCSVDEASRIRTVAARRKMSISGFVLFSLYRHWRAVAQLRHSPPPSV